MLGGDIIRISKCCDSKVCILMCARLNAQCRGTKVLCSVLFGTNFAWPMAEGEDHPNYSLIPKDTDVLITHGPPKGNVDGMLGCHSLARHVERVRPKLLVCGHIHEAHGVEMRAGTCYANAANAKRGHAQMGWEPIVLDI